MGAQTRIKMHNPEEFIGLRIEVVNSKNSSLQKIKGKILDETKNSFKVLSDANEEKSLLKQGTVFRIGDNEVDGDNIICRPEERIKIKPKNH